MKKTLLFLLILVLSFNLAAAVVEDDFDRADGPLGTATNGNTWSVSTASGNFNISNEKLVFNETGTSAENYAFLELSNASPSRIDFTMNVSRNGALNTAYAILGGGSIGQYSIYTVFYNGSSGPSYYYNDGAAWTSTGLTLTPYEEYSISWRNIDYTSHTFDIYENDVLLVSGADFFGTAQPETHFVYRVKENNITSDCLTTGGSVCLPGNYTLNINDFYTNNPINNVTVTIDGTLFTNTTGNKIYTNISVNETLLYDLLVTGENYFSRTLNNYNLSADTDLELYQSQISFDAFEYITGNSLSDVNFTVNSTQDTVFYLSAGNYTVLAEKNGYYDLNYTFSVSPLDNTTINVTGLYNQVVTMNLESWDGTTINDYNGSVSNSEYGFSSAFTGPTFNYLQGLNATIYNEPDGYASETNNITTGNTSSYSYNQTFYNFNTLYITFRDADTNNIINNVDITYFSDAFSGSNSTTNGTMQLLLLEPEQYIMTYSSTSYDDNIYIYTMTNDSYDNLTLYLNPSASTTEITVEVIDEGLSPVGGAAVRALKHFTSDNTYKEVSSGVTNPDGETVFNLLTTSEWYKFTVTLDGEVLLTTDPFIITGTTIQLQIFTSENTLNYYDSVNRIVSSLEFNTLTNNFRFDFVDGNSVTRQFCLTTYRVGNLENTLVNNTCTTGSSGTILHNVNNISGVTYESIATTTLDGNEITVARNQHTFGDAVFGNLAIMLQVFLTVLFALSGAAAVELLFIAVPLSVVIGGLFGLHSISIIYTAPLVVIGLIVVYMLRRNN